MNYVVDNWSFDPFIIIAAALIAAHETGLYRLRKRSRPSETRVRRRRSYAFYGGLAVLLIAVVSPIDYWADYYFFAHMIEHILIMFFAPILICIGAPWTPLLHALPVGTRRRVIKFAVFSRLVRSFARGWAFLHPAMGRAGLVQHRDVYLACPVPVRHRRGEPSRSHLVHALELLRVRRAVLAADHRLPSVPAKTSVPFQMGAIIGTNVVMFILAMSLSILTNHSWYSVYDHLPGVTLSPFADQQIGAAILWICGDFWAIPALTYVIRRGIAREGSLSDLVDQVFRHRGTAAAGYLGRPE